MKKTFATVILTLAAALVSADELSQALPLSANQLPTEKKPVLAEKTSSDKSFTYLRMGITDTYPTSSVQVVPGLGLGYRLATGDGAVDISANYTRSGKDTAYFYTLPKATYLHYASPAKNQSLYGGVGLAFGGLKTKDSTTFQGLIPNATVGYEMNRNANWHTFMQLDVSQPAVSVDFSKSFFSLPETYPGPVAEFSIGAGF